MVRWYKIGKYWSMGNGKYGYIDEQGNRGIADSKSEARRKSGGKRSKSSKKGGGSMSGKNLRIAPIVGAVGGTVSTGGRSGSSPIELIQRGEYKIAVEEMTEAWTGIDRETGDFHLTNLTGWAGLIAGAVGSKVASKTGLNRFLPKGFNL